MTLFSEKKAGQRVRILITAISLAWAVLLIADAFPALRGAPGWFWDHALPDSFTRVLPLIAAVGAYLLLGLRAVEAGRTRQAVLLSVVFSVIISLAVIFVRHDDILYQLFAYGVGGESTGWHYAATMMDDFYPGGLGEMLARWPEFMAETAPFAIHVQVSPPGLPLIFRAIADLVGLFPGVAAWLASPLRAWICHDPWVMAYTDAELASAYLGMAMPLWGALAAPLFFKIGKEAGQPEAGLLAAMLWPLTPSLQMFSYYPTHLFALLSLVILLFIMRGLRGSSWRWMAAAGLAASLLTFIALSSITLLYFAGLVTLLYYFTRRRGDGLAWHWPFRMGLYFGLGLSITWLAYWIVSGVTPWAVFGAMLSQHYGIELAYWRWAWQHFYDFVIFMGIPAFVILIIEVATAFTRFRRQEPLSLVSLAGLAGMIMVLTLDFAGQARGETGRVWLFMWPPLLVMASSGRALEGVTRRWLGLTQGLVLIAIAVSLSVVEADIARAPSAAPVVEGLAESSTTRTVGAIFDDNLALDSVEGEFIEGGAALDLRLRWGAEERLDRPVHLKVLVIDPAGAVRAEAIVDAFGGAFPHACFTGSVVEMERIALPADLPAGDYWLSLSLVDVWTGEPIPVTLSDGTGDTQVGVGPFALD